MNSIVARFLYLQKSNFGVITQQIIFWVVGAEVAQWTVNPLVTSSNLVQPVYVESFKPITRKI